MGIGAARSSAREQKSLSHPFHEYIYQKGGIHEMEDDKASDLAASWLKAGNLTDFPGEVVLSDKKRADAICFDQSGDDLVTSTEKRLLMFIVFTMTSKSMVKSARSNPKLHSLLKATIKSYKSGRISTFSKHLNECVAEIEQHLSAQQDKAAEGIDDMIRMMEKLNAT